MNPTEWPKFSESMKFCTYSYTVTKAIVNFDLRRGRSVDAAQFTPAMLGNLGNTDVERELFQNETFTECLSANTRAKDLMDEYKADNVNCTSNSGEREDGTEWYVAVGHDGGGR